VSTRESLINRARAARQEIEQIFLDVDHWNRIRPAHEAPIDPDPDGALARALEQAVAIEVKLRVEP
jgi:hypothetical protein